MKLDQNRVDLLAQLGIAGARRDLRDGHPGVLGAASLYPSPGLQLVRDLEKRAERLRDPLWPFDLGHRTVGLLRVVDRGAPQELAEATRDVAVERTAPAQR
jgi:hypothetical protein